MRSSLPLLLPIIGTATILLAGCTAGDRSVPADLSSSGVLPQARIAHPAWCAL